MTLSGDEIKSALDALDIVIEVQKNCLKSQYQVGLCNGLLIAKSMITGEDVNYVSIDDKKGEN